MRSQHDAILFLLLWWTISFLGIPVWQNKKNNNNAAFFYFCLPGRLIVTSIFGCTEGRTGGRRGVNEWMRRWRSDEGMNRENEMGQKGHFFKNWKEPVFSNIVSRYQCYQTLRLSLLKITDKHIWQSPVQVKFICGQGNLEKRLCIGQR